MLKSMKRGRDDREMESGHKIDAVNEVFAKRISLLLPEMLPNGFTEKRMFGGHCFLVNANMVGGIMKTGELCLQLDKARVKALLQKPHTKPVDFTGRVLKTMIYVESAALTAQ